MPRKQSINGEREITLSFLRGDINDKFIADIETGWTANFKGDKYHLFNEREDQHGNKEFDAVLDFFHHFNGRWHMDEVDDKSMTIDDSIRPLFDDSPYVLSIIDNFYANTMNYSKQQNSTERFLYFIGRHNAEFNIPIGTQTVQIRNKIGVQRNDVFIHEDDNLVDFNITTDTGSFCTAIKGYYRFRVPSGSGDSTEKEPTRTYDYISPMASKYGVIWGEPIHDERFDTLAGIQAATKQKQESTWKSSFEIATERFDTPLNIGDEVRFIVPSKSINGYIRVVEINEHFDEDGELIEATYTFGNENIASQYRKMQYDAIQDISDILNGRKPIPYSVLPKAVREATAIINAGDSTQFYYQEDGIYGFNKDNPNWSVRMNANGLGYSVDGGQNYNNAITHLGVVTEALTAGTIDANRITIYGARQTNRIEIDGDRIKVWDSSEPEIYTEIRRGRIHANRGALSISRADAYVDSAGKQYGLYMQNGIPKLNMNAQRNQFMHSDVVSFTGQRYQMSGKNMSSGQTYNMETVYNTHDHKLLTVGFGSIVSGTASAYVLFEVVEIGGGVVASSRQYVQSGETVWGSVTVNVGVPDFSSPKAYYLRAGLETVYNATYLQVVINRVSMHG